MKKILLVFDKFKDALGAAAACSAAEEALREVDTSWLVDVVPLTDGGEGFAEILTRSAGGALASCRVCGPRFAPVDAVYGRVRLEDLPSGMKRNYGFPETGTLAVVDMAQASGLGLLRLSERNPFETTTYGTGEVLAAAAKEGAAAILMGVGGSATQDAGLGALAALGLKRIDEGGNSGSAGDHPGQPYIPRVWDRIVGFATEGIATLPPVWIACDVENPLLGANGAAAVFAPQKGADETELSRLEEATSRMAELLCRAFGAAKSVVEEPGAGAAGGISFGLQVAFGARRVPGYDLVAEWLGLEDRIRQADLVITGEGRFDSASLSGKGPGRIVKDSAAMGKQVVVLAGAVQLSETERMSLDKAGVRLEAITPPEMPMEEALPLTGEFLTEAVRRVIGDR